MYLRKKEKEAWEEQSLLQRNIQNHIKGGKKKENDEKHAKQYQKSTEHAKETRRQHYLEGSIYYTIYSVMGLLLDIWQNGVIWNII